MAAHQAPPSLGFSRQGHWSCLPCLPSGNLPSPGIEPMSLMSPVSAGGFFTSSTTWEAWQTHAATAAKSLQSCPTLCDPIDGSPPGSPVSGFSRQEYWSRLPCLPPGDLPDAPDPGIEPMSLMSPVLTGGFFTTSATWEAQSVIIRG